MSAYTERGSVFSSGDNRLVGITALPQTPAGTGVLFLVGGPQYRVGSHRQFTLLSRSLAAGGIPAFRFDYSGMGDSEGEKHDFQDVRSDIVNAMDEFQSLVPGLERIVLWGLCDAASAAMIYASQEPRVHGLVLLNPWVHSGDYSPEVKLSHYYAPLLKGKETWRRFFKGDIDVLRALREFAGDSVLLVRKAAGKSLGVTQRHPFVDAMLEGLRGLQRPVPVHSERAGPDGSGVHQPDQ